MSTNRKAAQLPSRKHTVAEVHQRWPQTIPIFLRHDMKCVGCTMAAFETLDDVTKIYGLPLESFLAELRQEIAPAE